MTRVIFVTGTDTGVGKTVFTALFARWLRGQGHDALALKPLASGDRSDAEALERAMDGALDLDWINPWHFAAPVAPLVAARAEGRRVAAAALLAHVRATCALGNPVLVEGAGGVLSPLLEDTDAPALIEALDAVPVIVAANRLGVVNQVRLAWNALPEPSRRAAQVVLVDHGSDDASVATNPALLGEYLGSGRIHAIPRLGPRARRGPVGPGLSGTLAAVARGLGVGAKPALRRGARRGKVKA